MNNMELINNPYFIYFYRSPVGTFFIRYNPSLKKWDLGMDDEVFGYYTTTIGVADDVYMQHTGCHEWDMLHINNIPTDIYEWKKKKNEELIKYHVN